MMTFDPEEAADPFFDDRPLRPFASGKVMCPECGADLPVPILGRLNGSGREVRIQIEPDLSDVWAHAWTHGVGEPA